MKSPDDDPLEDLVEDLLPVAAALAEAVCDGDGDEVRRAAAAVAHWVRSRPGPDAVAAVDEALPAVLARCWEEDRLAGVPAPGGPGRLTFDESLELTVRLLDTLGASLGAAQLVLTRGRHALDEGRVDRAARFVDDGDRRLGAFPVERVGGIGMHARGTVALAGGDLAAAREWFERAADASRRAGLPRAEQDSRAHAARAAALAFRDASAAAESERWEEADRLWRAARATFAARADDESARLAADAARGLGIVAFSVGDPDAAERWFRTAEGEFARLGHRAGLGAVHFAWGNAAVSRGDAATAEPLLRAAYEELSETGNRPAAAACLQLLGALATFRGAPDGVRLARLADRGLDDPEIALTTRLQQALATAAADPGAAARVFEEARDRYAEQGVPARAAAAGMQAVVLLFAAGERARAEASIPSVTRLFDEAARDGRNRWLAALAPGFAALFSAMLAGRGADHEAVRRRLAEARDGFLRAGSPLVAARIAATLGELELDAGRPREAMRHLVAAVTALGSLVPVLPSPAERRVWTATLHRVVVRAVSATAATGDPRLLCELLESLRAQSMPVAVDDASGAVLPIEAVLQDAARLLSPADGARRVPPPTTLLQAPARIRMPWGTVALADELAQAECYLPSPSPPARLTVPLTVLR